MCGVTDQLARMKRIQQSWKKLKRLNALPIELERRNLIRQLDREALADAARLEPLLAELGLNDEGLEEYPAFLHPHCGQGLRIWQLPNQFSRYLAALSRLGIESYLEIGVRHGGAFVATVEYLDRFRPLRFALAIDVIPSPSLVEYQRLRPGAEFIQINSQSPAFRRLLEERGEIDLVFIDSFHEEEQLRRELLGVQETANVLAFHDIVSQTYPGVGRVWREVREMENYVCQEFTDQYTTDGTSHMGIGLAVRGDRQVGP